MTDEHEYAYDLREMLDDCFRQKNGKQVTRRFRKLVSRFAKLHGQPLTTEQLDYVVDDGKLE